nr:glycosyltransferase family 2 protein [Gemmiger qucibialis]
MEHIAVSVIVPIYNAEPWLEECVQSILGQDFPASYGTIEVLLIDDGATDGSGALCDRLAKRDNRIKVVHQENQGFPARATPALIWPAAAIMPLLTATMWCARRT